MKLLMTSVVFIPKNFLYTSLHFVKLQSFGRSSTPIGKRTIEVAVQEE